MESGVSLSFEVGGTYRRVAGQKITLEVNSFMFSLKVGTRVPPSNENPGSKGDSYTPCGMQIKVGSA